MNVGVEEALVAAGSPEEGVACASCVGDAVDAGVEVADSSTEWTRTRTRMVGTWRRRLLVKRRSSVARCHRGQARQSDAADGATRVTRQDAKGVVRRRVAAVVIGVQEGRTAKAAVGAFFIEKLKQRRFKTPPATDICLRKDL